MNLIIVSPETAHPAEAQIYQKIISEPTISHIHLRRKKALTKNEWTTYKPFANKMIFSDSCGTPPYRCLGLHGTSSRFSISAHNISEALKSSAKYCYISPIYTSISKPGYSNDALLPAIKELPYIPANWVALGGITAEHFNELKRLGFKNAAVLGTVWNHPKPLQALHNLLHAL